MTSSGPATWRAAWEAPTADAPVKQQLVLTLVEEIIVDIDDPSREVILIIHWRGGQHSEVRALKPKTGEHRQRTSDDAAAVIRQMAGTWSDAQMATALNWMGSARAKARRGPPTVSTTIVGRRGSVPMRRPWIASTG